MLIENTALYSLVSKSLHYFSFTSDYLLKTEEVIFQAKFCLNFGTIPSLKLGTFSNFDNLPIVLCHSLGIAKISLKNLFYFSSYSKKR